MAFDQLALLQWQYILSEFFSIVQSLEQQYLPVFSSKNIVLTN